MVRVLVGDAVEIGDEVYTIYEHARKNLGKHRGRVRRICVLTPKGTQINLLASSTLSAKQLLEIMIGRWRQENGFKHGNERWGINVLDGRRTVQYSPDTIIPNPTRRRLDHAIRIARVSEGDARRKLAMLDQSEHANETKRAALERELSHAIETQQELVAMRPTAPKYVELGDSELAGKLVHHLPDYKRLIDVVRIACANAESELAAQLAPVRPALQHRAQPPRDRQSADRANDRRQRRRRDPVPRTAWRLAALLSPGGRVSAWIEFW